MLKLKDAEVTYVLRYLEQGRSEYAALLRKHPHSGYIRKYYNKQFEGTSKPLYAFELRSRAAAFRIRNYYNNTPFGKRLKQLYGVNYMSVWRRTR